MVVPILEQFIESEEWTGKEGCLPDGRYKSTWDAIGGCWNIGPGLTKGITRNTVMTKEEIDIAYAKELSPFIQEVKDLVKISITNNELSALVSFAYNIGEGGFKESPIPGLINSGHKDQVPAHLKLYVHGRNTGKQVIPGLVNRRRAECEMWNTPDNSPSQGAAYVPHYDPASPVPKGAVTLEIIMNELATTVSVPLSATTAIVSQIGHKVVTATQGFFLTFFAYLVSHIGSTWDLVGIDHLSTYACAAIIAGIEWYKHEWVNNSNETTMTIVNSLEAKLKELEAGSKG
jgi:lysozyme